MPADKLFRGGVVMQVYMASIPFSWMCSNTLQPAPPSPTKCTGLVVPALQLLLPGGKRLGNIAMAPHVVSPFMASRLFIAARVFDVLLIACLFVFWPGLRLFWVVMFCWRLFLLVFIGFHKTLSS